MPGQERTQVVRGSLAPYATGFELELRSRGYSPSAVRLRLWQFDHVSRWLEARELHVHDLTTQRVRQFLTDRQAEGYKTWVSHRSMNLPVGYLQAVGVVAAPELVKAGEVDTVLEAYHHYLLFERGLTVTTVTAYVGDAEMFLLAREGPDGLHLERLGTAEVLAFVKHECARRRVSSAQHMLVSLRSLLRYLHLSGGFDHDPLAAAVPAMARRRQFLPRGVEPAHVARLLVSCDRRRNVGRRDYAILMLLARLGLRAGEVAALRLDRPAPRIGTSSIVGSRRRLNSGAGHRPAPRIGTSTGPTRTRPPRRAAPVIDRRRWIGTRSPCRAAPAARSCGAGHRPAPRIGTCALLICGTRSRQGACSAVGRSVQDKSSGSVVLAGRA